MRFSTIISSIGLFAALVSCAPPAHLYRGDSNSPADVKAAGGIKAKGFGRSNIMPATQENLFKHVSKLWGTVSPQRDPFISTSDKKEVSQGSAASSAAYVYTIDSSKITEKIWHCAQEYKDAKKTYPHAEECEWSVVGEIPWAAIISCEKKTATGWVDAPLPAKRGLRGQNAFWDQSASRDIEQV